MVMAQHFMVSMSGLVDGQVIPQLWLEGRTPKLFPSPETEHEAHAHTRLSLLMAMGQHWKIKVKGEGLHPWPSNQALKT